MDRSIETPSGKTAGTENFPVGSFLIKAELRPHVHAFYRFARMGDDIADNPALSGAEKLRRLGSMADQLVGRVAPAHPIVAAMAESLQSTGVAPVHCLELLDAFRMDAEKARYADWAELMEYCRLSAATVGRQVLDLHGESRDTWGPSDALCAALQVINHLQDCGDDYRDMDRVYLPAADLEAGGGRLDDLGGRRLTPGLRAAIDRCLDRTEQLLVHARDLPGRCRNFRLRCETAAIVALAERLTDMLRHRDPLAERVKLDSFGKAVTAATGVWRALFVGRPGERAA